MSPGTWYPTNPTALFPGEILERHADVGVPAVGDIGVRPEGYRCAGLYRTDVYRYTDGPEGRGYYLVATQWNRAADDALHSRTCLLDADDSPTGDCLDEVPS